MYTVVQKRTLLHFQQILININKFWYNKNHVISTHKCLLFFIMLALLRTENQLRFFKFNHTRG